MTAEDEGTPTNSTNGRNGGEDDDGRMRRRSFLYVVRHDLSLIRIDLPRLLELNEEYAKSGSRDWRWRQVREHAGTALTNLDERVKFIRRNLGEIRDLTRRDPSLEPDPFILQTIYPSADVFDLATTITDPRFQQPERQEMVTLAQREIQRLDDEMERLDELIHRDNDAAHPPPPLE